MEPVIAAHEDRLLRFERAVLPHLDHVYAAALLITGSAEVADDLVQDTFAHAYASFHQIRRSTDVRSWLYEILTRILPTSGERQPVGHDPQAVDHSHPGQPAETGSHIHLRLGPAQREALNRLPDAEVKRALHELPEDLRITVYLADVENYTYTEIADITGWPVPAVAARRRHGRRRLRDLLLSRATSAGLVPQ